VTEIRVQVELAHRPALVWRAFTEARTVTDWLRTTRFMLTPDGRFTLHATGLAGLEDEIEGEVLSSDAPYQMVMSWRAPNLHTRVSLTLRETPTGCRLTMVQQGFLGPHGTMRRRVLQRTYTDLFHTDLAAALDRLVAREAGEAAAARRTAIGDGAVVGARRNAGHAFERPRSASAPGLTSTVPAAVVASASVPAGPVRTTPAAWLSARRGPAVAAGAALLLLIAMTALLVARATESRPADPPAVGGGPSDPGEAAVPGEARTAHVPQRGVPDGAVTSPGSSTITASATPFADATTLTAVYRQEASQVAGYDASITITNLGTGTVSGWTVTLTLPLLGLQVHDVEGAVTTQEGRVLTFRPVDATRQVAPGRSVRVAFQVNGFGVPSACTIDSSPCTGFASERVS
jgi:uncharacterized protein YndB with AHSA1/START domain